VLTTESHPGGPVVAPVWHSATACAAQCLCGTVAQWHSVTVAQWLPHRRPSPSPYRHRSALLRVLCMAGPMKHTDSSGDWVLPSPCRAGLPPLTAEQIHSWRNQGFCVVDGLLPARLCEQAVLEIEEHEAAHPGTRTSMLSHVRSTPQVVPTLQQQPSRPTSPFDFSNPERDTPMEFPSVCPSINHITLHRRVASACRQLLGHAQDAVGSLRLLQSQLLSRTGPDLGVVGSCPDDMFSNIFGQRIHADYPNNTLLAPPAFGSTPEAVQILLYLSDVEEVGGSTAVVGCQGIGDEAYHPSRGEELVRAGQLGIPPHIWTNDREQTEALVRETHPELAAFRERLYAREKLVKYSRGTALLYRMDLWHRGTRCFSGVMRRTMQLAYRDADAEWCTSWHRGWGRSMYDPCWTFESLLARASVEQRAVRWPWSSLPLMVCKPMMSTVAHACCAVFLPVAAVEMSSVPPNARSLLSRRTLRASTTYHRVCLCVCACVCQLLGWPPPGHRYWRRTGTLAAVTRRYGPLGFDPAPYQVAHISPGPRL
jgi:hypothetical protein